jgi:hypothetical protein
MDGLGFVRLGLLQMPVILDSKVVCCTEYLQRLSADAVQHR